MIGVELTNTPDGPQIVQVVPDSPGQLAGLRNNDLILGVNQKDTSSVIALVNAIRAAPPGGRVELAVRRGEANLKLNVTLSEQFGPRSSIYNLLRGPVSKRSSGFPSVLQHDTVLKPSECGGPLVNLDGKVVGVNIARAGRAESLAIPAAAIIPLIEQLRAGPAAPAATLPARP
jgi:serine protease Do